MGRVILIGGGARSGKSRFALHMTRRLAAERGGPCTMIATAEALDDEMRHRIALHKAERAETFVTIEEPIDVASRLDGLNAGALLVDCLTLWLSNLILRDEDERQVTARLDVLLTRVSTAPYDAVIVSNEVGLSIVPEHELGRRFRDIAGRAHQLLAARAAEVYLAVMGLVLRLKPGPIEAMDNPEYTDARR
jgi:adenosylcobinamide kinase/adenosylcobinamide-phosphate guanylyltransferase